MIISPTLATYVCLAGASEPDRSAWDRGMCPVLAVLSPLPERCWARAGPRQQSRWPSIRRNPWRWRGALPFPVGTVPASPDCREKEANQFGKKQQQVSLRSVLRRSKWKEMKWTLTIRNTRQRRGGDCAAWRSSAARCNLGRGGAEGARRWRKDRWARWDPKGWRPWPRGFLRSNCRDGSKRGCWERRKELRLSRCRAAVAAGPAVRHGRDRSAAPFWPCAKRSSLRRAGTSGTWARPAGGPCCRRAGNLPAFAGRRAIGRKTCRICPATIAPNNHNSPSANYNNNKDDCYPAGYFGLGPQFHEQNVPDGGHASLESVGKEIGLQVEENVVEAVEQRCGRLVGRQRIRRPSQVKDILLQLGSHLRYNIFVK